MIYAGNLIQAGYGIAYAADAKVIHSHNYSCMQQFHRNFDLGVSQAEHPEIFASVKSEGEGIRLVKQTFRYLLSRGKIWLIPGFVMQSGCKYAGYLAGKNIKTSSQSRYVVYNESLLLEGILTRLREGKQTATHAF